MKLLRLLAYTLMINLFSLSSCGNGNSVDDSNLNTNTDSNLDDDTSSDNENNETDSNEADDNLEGEVDMNQKELKLTIDNKSIDVKWEVNDSVKDLISKAGEGITVNATRYGGFEQVGSLGRTIVSNDTYLTSTVGDIFLYSRNQIVIFFGSNSWQYTKLGHIENMSNDEIIALLDVPSVIINLTAM